MANIKISELEELVNVAEDDYFPIVDTSTGETKKIKVVYVGVGGKSGDTLPIGSISAYSGEEIPSNWLKCNGQAISRTTYADLFSVIGTTYGSGDGSTTFNLPNISERVIVGNAGDGEFSLGNTGGEKEHTLTVNEMPEHYHAGIKYANFNQWLTSETGSNGNTIGLAFNTGGNPLSSVKSNENLQYSTDKRGGSQAHNNMQPYIALNYIIKAKQSAGVVGTVTSDINDTNDNAVPNAKTVKDYVEEVYSTDEVKTNKVWIDGKPIYRKVYEISSLPNNGRMYVDCNIPNVQHVITMRGVMESSTEWDNMPSAYTGGALIDSLVIERSGNTLTNIRILNNTDRSGFSAFVILEYTKTTSET